MPNESPIYFPCPGSFHNLTGKHTLKKGIATPRDMKKVDTIVLHQTAGIMSGVEEDYLDYSAHIAILRDGRILYINDLSFQTWHGHGFNSESIGIEIEGHFAGIEGDPKTIWDNRKTHDLKPEQVDAARNAITWAILNVVPIGGTFKKIVAHRQSSNERDSDPGSLIWRSIGLWAQTELKLENQWWGTVGSGTPLPRAWDTRSLFGWRGQIDKVGIAMVQAVANARLKTGLDIDGVVGPKTRAAIGALRGDLLGAGTSGSSIDNPFIEALSGTAEFNFVVQWLDSVVTSKGIPVNLMGNDLLDVFDAYPKET